MSSSDSRPVQAGIQEWKNKISIRSYPDSKAENRLPPHVRTPEIQNLEISDTTMSRLCYACHTTWTSKNIRGRAVMGTDIPAPIWASVHSMDGDVWARKRVNAQDMQAIIGDSLLDSSWWCMVVHSCMIDESHCVSRAQNWDHGIIKPNWEQYIQTHLRSSGGPWLWMFWVWSLHTQLVLRVNNSWRLALPITYSVLCHGPSMHLQYSRQLALDTIWSNKHRHYYVRAPFTIGVVAVLFGWTFNLFSDQHCHYNSSGISPSCKSQKPTQYAFIVNSSENHSIRARPQFDSGFQWKQEWVRGVPTVQLLCLADVSPSCSAIPHLYCKGL